MAAGPSSASASARTASPSDAATPSPIDGGGGAGAFHARFAAHAAGDDGGEADGSGSGGRKASKRAAEPKLDKDGNPKKKRKQLVACDSCRLRRVKCDKAEKDGGDCSECTRKAIHCTDTYVKNKPKVVRGGKLINQAKALYGDNGGMSPSLTSPPSPVKPEYDLAEDPRRLSLSAASPLDPRSPSTRLASMSLNHDLGDHLIRTFFDMFQPQCPLVDVSLFLPAWENAGRMLENLSPANECMALVIQAWAARLTDHPAVVGSGAPTLQELRSGGGRDFTPVGNRREEFARAAMERAMAAVDQRGALRLASSVCCAALTLLEFLVTWSDAKRTSTTGRYLLAAASEHLRNLQLDQCDDPTERPLRPEQASNGTLLWMVYTRDSLAAMFGGRFCCLTDDDLSAFSPLLTGSLTADPIPYITSTDPSTLSGIAVACIFRYLVSIVRNTVVRLTGPIARRQRVTEQTMHELWADIDEGNRFGQIFHNSVQHTTFPANSQNPDVWFRDLVAMRSQHLLGIHLCLADRLREEDTKAATQALAEGDAEYAELLRRLLRQSDERLFRGARDYCELLYRYGGNMLFSATVTVEYSSYFLTQLVETPAWEQGGPSDYAWSTKVDEVSRCIDVVKLAGWAWSGYDGVIERARQSLAQQSAQLHHRMPPSAPPALLPPISTSYAPGGLVAGAPQQQQQYPAAPDWAGLHVHPPQQQGGALPPPAGLFDPHKLSGGLSRPPSFSSFSPLSPSGGGAAPPTPQSLPGSHAHPQQQQQHGQHSPGMLAPPLPPPGGASAASFVPPGPHAADPRRRTLPPISTYRLSPAEGAGGPHGLTPSSASAFPPPPPQSGQ
ncbi:hypothetical protein JCM10449v2_003080 [Rhodotorula kratochvilovae]